MMCFSSVFYVFLYPWMNEICPVKILFLCQLLSGHHSSCLGLRAVGRLVPRFHLVVVEPLTIIIAVLVISHTGALAPVYSLNHHSLAAGFHHFQALSLFEPCDHQGAVECLPPWPYEGAKRKNNETGKLAISQITIVPTGVYVNLEDASFSKQVSFAMWLNLRLRLGLSVCTRFWSRLGTPDCQNG